MKQDASPFHETAEDATNTAIIRSGKSFKEVALTLWPEMKTDSAYAKLKNSLRPETREKLTADQHILIGNLVGQYDFLHYAAHSSSHSAPEPVEPVSALAEQRQQFISAVDQLSKLAASIAETESKLKAVS